MGAASYCGIPLTHRGLSQSVSFTTGHKVQHSNEDDWQGFARAHQTLVIYMGLVGLEHIAPAERAQNGEDREQHRHEPTQRQAALGEAFDDVIHRPA